MVITKEETFGPVAPLYRLHVDQRADHRTRLEPVGDLVPSSL
jgi:acyl-CoA reductase-like NAD-dependent aldehyde dehydrogenase